MKNLSETLRTRRTEKILGDSQSPLSPSGEHKATVDELLASAGWAPYHYPCDKAHRETELTSPVPWRFYKLDTADCRALMTQLDSQNSGAGKIAAMLATADALLLVTWLPDPPSEPLGEKREYDGTQRNMEHIAAAAAAVQSMLLLATESGYRTYWSTGGVLREPAVFDRLKIPTDQVLLGAVFLNPQDVGEAQIKPGAWRDKRGDLTDWSAWRSASS